MYKSEMNNKGLKVYEKYAFRACFVFYKNLGSKNCVLFQTVIEQMVVIPQNSSCWLNHPLT